jgi:hypothetical protein
MLGIGALSDERKASSTNVRTVDWVKVQPSNPFFCFFLVEIVDQPT